MHQQLRPRGHLLSQASCGVQRRQHFAGLHRSARLGRAEALAGHAARAGPHVCAHVPSWQRCPRRCLSSYRSTRGCKASQPASHKQTSDAAKPASIGCAPVNLGLTQVGHSQQAHSRVRPDSRRRHKALLAAPAQLLTSREADGGIGNAVSAAKSRTKRSSPAPEK